MISDHAYFRIYRFFLQAMAGLSYLGLDLVDGLIDQDKLFTDIKKLKVSNNELKAALKASEEKAQATEQKAGAAD